MLYLLDVTYNGQKLPQSIAVTRAIKLLVQSSPRQLCDRSEANTFAACLALSFTYLTVWVQKSFDLANA